MLKLEKWVIYSNFWNKTNYMNFMKRVFKKARVNFEQCKKKVSEIYRKDITIYFPPSYHNQVYVADYKDNIDYKCIDYDYEKCRYDFMHYFPIVFSLCMQWG